MTMPGYRLTITHLAKTSVYVEAKDIDAARAMAPDWVRSVIVSVDARLDEDEPTTEQERTHDPRS